MTWLNVEQVRSLPDPLRQEIQGWAVEVGLADTWAINFDPLHGLVCQIERYQLDADGNRRLNLERNGLLREIVDITHRKITFPDELRRLVLQKAS